MGSQKRAGYRVEQAYSFPTERQFTKRFKFSPKTLGQDMVSLVVEDGNTEVKGVICELDPDEPWRKVTFFCEQVVALDETVLRAEDRLRELEPLATFQQLGIEKSQKVPGVAMSRSVGKQPT